VRSQDFAGVRQYTYSHLGSSTAVPANIFHFLFEVTVTSSSGLLTWYYACHNDPSVTAAIALRFVLCLLGSLRSASDSYSLCYVLNMLILKAHGFMISILRK